MQLVLDIGGLIPLIGEPLDLINAGIYTARGDYVNAALSGASAIPIAGWAASGAKGINKAVDAVDAARDLNKLVDTADAIRDAGRVTEIVTAAGKIPAIGPDDLVVIGRQWDTKVAQNWPGHSVLDIKDWNIAKNDAWIQQAIDQRNNIYLASPTAGNLTNAAGEATVFARELEQLRGAGFTQVGDYLIPPP